MKPKILFIAIIIATLFSCKKDENTDPELSTSLAIPLSASTCYIKANVSEKGSYDILDYGFVYSPSNSYISIDNGNKISLGKALSVDTFSTVFSYDNSYSYQNYYVRAYITNTKGTVYGSSISFQPLTISILSVYPKSGKVGDSITITGSNFSLNADDNVVKFNTVPAKILKATAKKLIVAVPSGIQLSYWDSNIYIYVGTGNQTINASSFTFTTTITGFSPKTGTFGTGVTLTGENLNFVTVKCNNEDAYVNTNSGTSLSFDIPYSIKSEKVKIKVIKNGIETIVDGDFSMNPLSISAVTPQIGYVGTEIYVTGVNFNTGYGSTSLKVGGASVTSCYTSSPTTISGYVPALSVGTYDVEVNNGITSSVLSNAFTVIVPKVTGFSPSSGSYGSQITILGENLSSYPNVMLWYSANNYTYANIVSQDASKIIFTVPFGLRSGTVKLHVFSGFSDLTFADDFTIEPLSTTISSFTPNSGSPGTEVTINGSGFVQGYTEVKFGTISAPILSNTSTALKAQVPSNAGKGAMKISVVISGNTVVSDNNFTIL